MKARTDPVFYVDRSLGRYGVVIALRAAGLQVEAHDDHFAQNAPDVEWLEDVPRRGWVILTKDGHISKNPLELAAVRAAEARVFTLNSQQLNAAGMAAAFVHALPAIRRVLNRQPAPFIAVVHRTGRVEVRINFAER